MKKLEEIAAGIGLVLAAIFGFFWISKNKEDAVLAENAKVKEDLAKKDQEVAVNNASLKQEEVTRTQLKEDMEKTKNEEVTNDNVLDFFNERK